MRAGLRRSELPTVFWAAAVLLHAESARAQAGLTQEEALRVAFPAPATIERRTAFLTEEDLAAVRAAAGSDVPVEQTVVTYYLGRRDSVPLGVAYFDRHRVRTRDEVLMIVVAPNGTLRSIEVLRFNEPPEYRAPPEWVTQLEGKELSDRLSLQGAIVNLTGATLTSQAIVRAARRVLAMHRRIRPLAQDTASAGASQ